MGNTVSRNLLATTCRVYHKFVVGTTDFVVITATSAGATSSVH